jgi:hypothetical protein
MFTVYTCVRYIVQHLHELVAQATEASLYLLVEKGFCIPIINWAIIII